MAKPRPYVTVVITLNDAKEVHRLSLYRMHIRGRIAWRYRGKMRKSITATELGRRLGSWLSPST